MALILASGDNHFDEHSRFAECRRIHTWIAEQVAKEKPACFLDPGDIYERLSTIDERNAVVEWVMAITETCPMLITKGNHDRRRDLAILGNLRTKHPITIVESCGIYEVGGLKIAAVAWPDRGSIAAMVGSAIPPEAVDDVARDCLRNVFRGLAQYQPDILMGHFMVDGSKVSRGQPLIGAELNVGLVDLALARPKIVVASHVHCPQEWEYDGIPMVYCGSPYRTAYGETETKSILCADVAKSGVEWSRIVTPATPMLLFTGAWDGSKLSITSKEFPHKHVVPGAEIRFRYSAPADQREAAKNSAEDLKSCLLEQGALSVKLEEETIATTRARAPEITTVQSLPDKLRVFWKHKQIDVPPPREARLFGKLGEIEAVAA